MSALDHFTALDELIQIIYQGVDRFVVLSNATDEAWTVSVGLEGPEGRWWQGKWEEDTVLNMVGHDSPDRAMEQFAQQLANHVVAGELYLTDWSPEKGARVKLTLGPTANRPVHVLLKELDAEAAAAMATTVFLSIALQAQSRGSQLRGSLTSGLVAPLPEVARASSPRDKASKSILAEPSTSKTKATAGSEDKNEDLVPTSASRKQLSKPKVQPGTEPEAKKRKIEAVKPAQSSQAGKPAKPAARGKGVSLANPTKKARKYQALEFGSDED